MNDKKHIVIVGGTSGLGLASAEYLLDKGYNVMVLGRNQPQTKKNLSFHQVDVTDELSLKAFFDENKISEIDGLIYSAGLSIKQKPINKFSSSEYSKIHDVNLLGALLTFKYSYDFLRRSKGRVVIVNSIAARTYSEFSGIEYTITKSGLSGLVRHLAVDWAKDSILINSVFPSMIDTPMLKDRLSTKEINQIHKSIPLGRIASTSDVIDAIEFLISDRNTYITGSGIDLNGGKFLSS